MNTLTDCWATEKCGDEVLWRQVDVYRPTQEYNTATASSGSKSNKLLPFHYTTWYLHESSIRNLESMTLSTKCVWGANSRRQRARVLPKRCVSSLLCREGYPQNAYALLLVMFHYFVYLARKRRSPVYAFLKNMTIPWTCLLLSQFVQIMFVGFVIVKTGPLCVCVHPNLVNTWLSWGAVTLYVVSVYLDIQETYNMIDFQLLTNTEPHIVAKSKQNAFGSVCLVRLLRYTDCVDLYF